MESFIVGRKMPTRAVKNGGVGEMHRGNPRSAMGKSGVFNKYVGKEEEKGSLKNSCNIQTISCSDESSSSIGRNSDASMEKSGDGEEVQSSFKCTFDAAMEALEEVLPIRRGISRFYNGKSISFACLGDASSSPLAKPDNAYKRRRRSSNVGGRSNRVMSSSSRAVALNKMGNHVVMMDQC